MVDMITGVKHNNIEQGEKICCILHYGCRRNLIDCNLPFFSVLRSIRESGPQVVCSMEFFCA